MSQWVTESLICWFTTVFPVLKGIQFFQNSLWFIWQKYNILLFQRDFSFSKFPLIISANIKYSSVTKSFLLFKINLSFQFFLDQPSRAKQSCLKKIIGKSALQGCEFQKSELWRDDDQCWSNHVDPINQIQNLVFNLKLVWSEDLYPAFRLDN